MNPTEQGRAATAHVNAIGTALPPHEVHAKFLDYAPRALPLPRERALFARMAARSGIERRRSVLEPAAEAERLDAGGFFRAEAETPTSARMALFAAEAPALAEAALADLGARLGPRWAAGLTHLITVTCTGFTAPGIDAHLIARCGLPADVERTQVGFMGCNAALNGLKLARHVVRSDPSARVLVVNVELCTLHFQSPGSLDKALTFLLFADGASAMLVTADPTGLALERFHQEIVPGTPREITWDVGDAGFDMRLSGDVPRHIGAALPAHVAALLGQAPLSEVGLWAVHPGGRSVLDAAEAALGLPDEALATSRAVLREHGNMSSVTVPFILARMLEERASGRQGVALGFGPGLGIESLAFSEAA